MAINRTGRATFEAIRATPVGIVAVESALTPARALLDHCQPHFSQRLLAKSERGGGLEILEWRPGLTDRPRALTGLRAGETVERQERGWLRTFQAGHM